MGILMTDQSPQSADTPNSTPVTAQQEQDALEAANALLALTQHLQSASNHAPELNLGSLSEVPEFGQAVLQRGLLIEAIGTLPFSRFSQETQQQIITILQQCQALDVDVLGTMQADRQKVADQLQGLKSAQSLQNKYRIPEPEDASATRSRDA
jgi:hypothetical protein